MVHIVGVHGIGQSRVPRSLLRDKWWNALTDGLGPGHDWEPELVVPHWAPLVPRGAHRLGPEDDPFDPSVPLAEGEEEFLVAACEDILGPESAAHALETPALTLGLPRLWPTGLTRLVAKIDQGRPGLGERVVKVLREVRYYLYEPGFAVRVRELVVRQCEDRTAIVVGHSLGGVIAYDLFRNGELPGTADGSVRTLITCGSPLALTTVRRALGHREDEPLDIPDKARWVNVYDPGDLVTGGRGLGVDVIEEKVDNGCWDPHAAERYLRSAPVARAVVDGRW